MLRDAERETAVRDEVFLAMTKGPTPLRAKELKLLIEKRPEIYGRYRNWLSVLP
jgi:hypothetical protein